MSTEILGGSRFGWCVCGWTGPFRRWAWRARWDTRRHVATCTMVTHRREGA